MLEPRSGPGPGGLDNAACDRYCHGMDIKICGLKTAETVAAALDGGASHLGFNFFARSPRYVTPEAAGGLIVAVIQASILLGGVIGGFLLDLWSVEATFAGSVLLAIVALAITGTGHNLLKPKTES